MIDMEKSSEPPQYMTQSDYRWLQQQIERSDRKLRILLDMLIAKKVINEAEAKIFQETKTNSEELLEWYIGTLKEKQTTK